MRPKSNDTPSARRDDRRHRRLHRARTILEMGLDALALASLTRRLGPRRVVRLAALATEGYLGEAGRDSRRRADGGRK